MSSFFVQKFFLRSLYVLTILVCNFLGRDLGVKAARKMLVKLTPGVVKVRFGILVLGDKVRGPFLIG